MRVLFVNTLYPPYQIGGAERSTAILAETLAAGGHDVHVLSTAPESGRQTLNGVTAHYWKTPNLYWGRTSAKQSPLLKPIWHLLDSRNPIAASRFRKFLHTVSPDLVHTNNLSGFSPSLWKTTADAGLPIVHTIRDYYLLCLKSAMFRNGASCDSQCTDCRIYSRIKRRYDNRVDAVVGISNFVLERHRRAGFFKSVSVSRRIFNPVPPQRARITLRRPGEQLKVGFIGKIAPHKGIEHLLSELADDDRPRFDINVFGTPDHVEYEQGLKKRYAHLKPTFHGFKDAALAFENIDVLVVPSQWSEPFGRVVIEANAHGIPAIVSNRGGLPEIVDDDRNGRIYDPEKPGDLRQALETVTGSVETLARYSEKSIRTAERYQPEAIASQYLEVYEEVLR